MSPRACALYYLHLFDDAVWFYRFRSLPLSELTASGAGLLAGLIQAWIVRKGLRLGALIPVLLLAGLFMPYLKPVVAPLDLTHLAAECRDGVCLQSTQSTCGPASVASILRMFNVEETEKTLAREAYTSARGTENWYLARALRRRGFSVRYVVVDRPVAKLPFPSVAGVLLPGDVGHFISILGETDTTYVVGDPMHGRVNVSKSRLGASYNFTGFFMVVGNPGA
jgi:predicted double-glycine peptidase